MASGTLNIKLRPFRLAFLVQPSDKAAIATAIETASFLWGGMFSPIIPVYNKLPKFWEPDTKRGFTAHSVLEGYLYAFDPTKVVKVGALETKTLEFGHRWSLSVLTYFQVLKKMARQNMGLECLKYFNICMKKN